MPNAPTNVNVNCAPGDDTASNATASWLPPVNVSGLTFVRYEYTWFFTDEEGFRSGQITDRNTTSVSSQVGEYIQGDTARFAIKAVYLDVSADPDVEVTSNTVTANGFCAMPLLAPSLTVSCAQTALTAAWSVVVPQGVTLVGFSYTVQFSGDEEEINADVGSDITTVMVPGFGEVITFILVARYTVGDDATEQQSPSAIASCGIPNSPTNLVIACLPDATGTGSTASASWIAPVEVSGLEFQRYEWTLLFDDELTTRTGQITDRSVTTVSSLSRVITPRGRRPASRYMRSISTPTPTPT